ncbi:MAG TPA: lysophospholipid acyltransferase family protein [Acidobacteriaceae bacterium]|jgi:1-acyl-sn-glycerol-3-phosphate acyltransferase|nr:lysophospholipid acyltransferase family protein [Acidobacteriaceae bacterium]
MPLEPELPVISSLTLRLFARIVRRYFKRHFRSVMTQNADRLRHSTGPLIVFGNHASWWDPLLLVLLARTLLPKQRHYAPIDAAALKRYPILGKLGLFPVDVNTSKGAAQFLRTARAVLREGSVLWITPQGRLADPREFPLRFRPGLAALAARFPEVPLLPMAVEYTFWDERLPETLVRFGEPLYGDSEFPSERLNPQLEGALAAEMLELQKISCLRDPSAFETLMTGGRGTGGLYGWSRRLRTLLTRKQVPLDHADRMRLL